MAHFFKKINHGRPVRVGGGSLDRIPLEGDDARIVTVSIPIILNPVINKLQGQREPLQQSRDICGLDMERITPTSMNVKSQL